MTATLSIKVPKAKKARLQALAQKRKTSRSQLMLEALDNLATESESASPVSCYELSKDLFEDREKLGASKDLDRSVNKDRMSAFGKSRG